MDMYIDRASLDTGKCAQVKIAWRHFHSYYAYVHDLSPIIQFYRLVITTTIAS